MKVTIHNADGHETAILTYPSPREIFSRLPPRGFGLTPDGLKVTACGGCLVWSTSHTLAQKMGLPTPVQIATIILED